MKTLTQLAICIFALSGSLFAQEEAAIRDLVKKYVEAREKIDPDATRALFTSDADQLVSTGEWRKGIDHVVQGSMKSSRDAKGGTRTITLESIRFITDTVAIADGRYVLTGAGQSSTRQMWTCLVFNKVGGQWKIAAIRNMLPAAP